MDPKKIILAFLAIIAALLATTGASAFSGFPARDYPSNQYGFGSTYYDGPWGERMVYGGPGFFPNFYGSYPYGYRTYGYIYTPADMSMSYGGGWGRGYASYSGYGYYAAGPY
jgi:hypothetical protein